MRLRNVAFVGPHHAGKTTLVEAILALTGAIGRRGSIGDGTTVTDHEPEDVAHLQSTTVGFAHTAANGVDISIVDAPGFVDFAEEMKQALAGVDAAVVVVEADPGRIVQTQAIVDYLESTRMPHIFVINKMDRPGADFSETLAALQSAYGRHVVAEQLPLGNAEHFDGFVDLAQMKAFRFAGDIGAGTFSESEEPVPAAVEAEARRMHSELLEAMADFDDHLMEELLEGIEPPLEEIERDLCEECSHDQVVPVLVSAGLSGAGVAALVRAIE
ncbi:MAG: GTP-binding protein, partial [Candidatus Cybelea sp.]